MVGGLVSSEGGYKSGGRGLLAMEESEFRHGKDLYSGEGGLDRIFSGFFQSMAFLHLRFMMGFCSYKHTCIVRIGLGWVSLGEGNGKGRHIHIQCMEPQWHMEKK